jgi:hypothetical protein
MSAVNPTPSTKSMSFMMRLRDFFGFLPGETLSEFKAEYDRLTDADKLEMHAEFNRLGMPTEMPKLKTSPETPSAAPAA